MRRISPRVSAAREVMRAPVFSQADRLVGFGFRHWLHGYRTGDISCWEKVWSSYSGVMGSQAAKGTLCRLSGWVRAIDTNSHRLVQTSPTDCAAFCRDECVAISMIAACQHNVCPAMRACAFALLGCSMIDEVVHVAEGFAISMREADQVLSPARAHALPQLADISPASTRH
jgi:hypothetical protein